ncbi:MAG: hypothetical protein JWQ74_1868 [Marmoricola sp.]|nr:hypothetical protein [Marmoricola sp.]
MSKQTMSQPRKHQVTARVSVVLLALALVVGVVALMNRADKPTASAEGTTTGKGAAGTAATPSARPTLEVPKKPVDPLRGRTYCATAKLLAYYTHQSYGLDASLGITEGKTFDKRLTTVASTFERLAAQAEDEKKARSSSASWSSAARAVRSTEDAFKASGMDVGSQVMIVQLAELNKVVRRVVPKATSTLESACGLSPALLGF